MAAEDDFKKLLALDPENSEALREIRIIKKTRQEPATQRLCTPYSWDGLFKSCSGLNRKREESEVELTRLRS